MLSQTWVIKLIYVIDTQEIRYLFIIVRECKLWPEWLHITSFSMNMTTIFNIRLIRRPFLDLDVSDRVYRGAIYFFVIAYCFLGVSIVADRFMSAIEVITGLVLYVIIIKSSLVFFWVIIVIKILYNNNNINNFSCFVPIFWTFLNKNQVYPSKKCKTHHW